MTLFYRSRSSLAPATPSKGPPPPPAPRERRKLAVPPLLKQLSDEEVAPEPSPEWTEPSPEWIQAQVTRAKREMELRRVWNEAELKADEAREEYHKLTGRRPDEDDRPFAILRKRRFDHSVKPPPLRAVYTLQGRMIATPGNMMAIASAVKTGKSAVIGAMLASTMSTDGGADLLAFSSANPEGLAVIHIDSEQSPDDHWHCVDRAIRRAKLSEPPSWLRSYCFSGLGWEMSRRCLMEAVSDGAVEHDGVHSILLDGIADFVNDPNDAAECNGFVAELHDLAIARKCCVVGVIHFNPGSDKTRGHLGSQFERKAETNLRLDKDDGEVTEMWSAKQRRAPIPKGSGPCFAWSDDDEMHVTVPNPSEARAKARAGAKLDAMREAARVVFAQGKKMLCLTNDSSSCCVRSKT